MRKRPMRVIVIACVFLLGGLWMAVGAGLFLPHWAEVRSWGSLGSWRAWLTADMVLGCSLMAAGVFVQIAAVEFLRLRAWARSALTALTWLALAGEGVGLIVGVPVIWFMWEEVGLLQRPGVGLGHLALIGAVNAALTIAVLVVLLVLLRGQTVRNAVTASRPPRQALLPLVGVVLLVSAALTITTSCCREPLERPHPAESGDVGELQELMREKAPVPEEELGYWLAMAAAHGRVKVVALLLERGVDPNEQYYGRLPLHDAAEAGHVEVVQKLLAHGADPKLTNAEGFTALRLGSRAGCAETVRVLLNAGAPVDVAASDGSTALHSASWSGCVECVELLLAAGADPNGQTELGRTPLRIAAQNTGRTDVIAALVAAGADVSLADQYGDTPLHAALNYGHKNAARLLLEYGAAVDARNHDGWTPLHLAAASGDIAIAKLLVARGANVNTRDNKGRTPTELAESAGHRRLAAWLRSRQAE